MKIIKIVLLCLLPIAITNCSSSGISYIGKEKWAYKMTQSTLITGDLSYKTEQFLIINALKDKFEEDPESVIKLLAQHVESPKKKGVLLRSIGPRYALYGLIELCMYQAKNTSKNDAMKYWVSCCFYSYKYLFDKNIDPPVNDYYNMLGMVYGFMYYNSSLAEIAKYLINKENLWNSEIAFDTVLGKVKITRLKSDLIWNPKIFKNFIITFNYIPVKFLSHSFNSGIGVPIIGSRKDNANYTKDKELTLLNLSYPFTFVLEFDDFSFKNGTVNAQSNLYDAFKDEFTLIKDKKVPLSKDYTIAIGNALTKKQAIKGLKYMFNPGKMGQLQELYMLSPYDPNKIPVVLVHGLMSEPRSWSEMLNSLLSSRVIRENFQFWFYSYPTGLSVIYTSAEFRKSLLAIKKKYDPDDKNIKFNNMIVVGYSMGGLLSRLIVQDSKGSFLFKNFLKTQKEIEDTKLTKEQKDFVKSLLIFKPLPFIRSVLFIGAPHKGANMATYFYSRLGSSLISLPANLTHKAMDVMKETTPDEETRNSMNLATGIDSLKPESKLNRYTANLPYSKNITLYSIVGNKEKAGQKNGTDGIVPYSSSHIDNGKSELIIKADHNSLIRKTETAKEITRILLLQLDEYKATQSR